MKLDPVKLTPWVAVSVLVLIGASYLVFLYASWHQFQQDKAVRDDKINELLERLPRMPADNEA